MAQGFEVLVQSHTNKRNTWIVLESKFKLFSYKYTLCEKCPNTEFFLVRIFLYLDGIRRFTPYFPIFSPNTGKYGPEKTPYLDTFHAVID